jgi:hypothetical protein
MSWTAPEFLKGGVMFDPLTVAFEIKYPWKGKGRLYRDPIVTVWHKDPCKDGSDDSCDWFGHKKTNTKIKALGEAIWSLETILDNKPFYPDHPAHLRFQSVKDAYYSFRQRSKFRLHPRYHIWHWRISIRPWQKFSVMGSWSGASIWHHRCNGSTHKPAPEPKEGL